MNSAWVGAFVTLCVVVIVLGVMVIGLMRRIAPILDRLEVPDSDSHNAIREGLGPGTRVGDFVAVTATGQLVNREAMTTTAAPRAVVLFLEPGCGTCENLMTELIDATWLAIAPLYLVVSDSTEARRRRLERSGGTVLYQIDRSVANAFATNATPVAFLLNEDGIVISRYIPRRVEELSAMANSDQDGTELSLVAPNAHRISPTNP